MVQATKPVPSPTYAPLMIATWLIIITPNVPMNPLVSLVSQKWLKSNRKSQSFQDVFTIVKHAHQLLTETLFDLAILFVYKQETSAITEKPMRRHVAGNSTHCLWNICLRTVGWPWNWGRGRVGVTQGHRKHHHSIARVRFRIRLLQELLPYLAPFLRYTDLLVKYRPIFLPPLVYGTLLGVKPSALSNNPRW